MDKLLVALQNLVAWLQIPVWGFLAVTLVIGGYCFTQGAEGSEKGKKWIKAGVIAVFIVKLAQIFTDDLETKLNFAIHYIPSYAINVVKTFL